MVKKGEVAGGKAHTISNLEGQMAAVCVGLCSLLGLGQSQFPGDGELHIADGVKVGSGRGGRGSRDSKRRGEGGVEAIVSEEGGLVGGRVGGVVVGKLSNRKPGDPISMLRLHVGTQDLLNGPMGAFCLAISLRMVGGGEIQLGAKALEQRLPEIGGEAGVTVRDQDARDATLGYDVLQENMGQLL